MPESGTERTLVGIVGAGGFAREVMPIAEAMFQGRADLVFVETEPLQTSVNGYQVLSEQDFITAPYDRKMFNIAIADSVVRSQISARLTSAGCLPQSLSAPNVTNYDFNEIGEGAILCANVVITSNARIGRYFHANLYSYVAHDCVVGDYVTFAPRVCCNGNVTIKDHAYIGTGAILKQGSKEKPLTIGEGAVVGMGAVVTKDVAPYTTVVGNPARILEKR